jgi:methylmalonyl-CoA mutase
MTAPRLAADFPPQDADAWIALVDKVLKGRPFDTLVSTTADGIRVPPLYTRDAAPGAADEAGFPGADPYTRGAHAAPRPHGLWDVRARVDHPDPAEANRRALQDLERGVTSLHVRWDEGTDLARVLDGVHLDLAPVVLDAGDDVLRAVDALTRLWSDRGLDPADVRGGYGADPIGTLAGRGGDPERVGHHLGVLGRLAAVAAAEAPGVRSVTVDATPVHEAGGSEAQELAYLLATGAAALRAMSAAGLTADAACAQVEVVLAADADVFTTVAKLRAARRLWSAMTGACGASEPARAPVLHARTGRRMLTVRDPWVNLLRVTAATFAAGVGGADGVTAHGYDALLADASAPGGTAQADLGRRMARNTQLLLQEESSLGRVLDPAGGSWFVESLTDELADVAWSLFQRLERDGGLPRVLVDGTLAELVAGPREERFRAVATRRSPITGVSEFPHLGEDLRPTAPPSPAPAGGGPLLAPVRWAEPYEELRDASDAHLAATGARPSVFLANLGPVAEHTARATFARNLFEAGGVEAVTSERGAGTGFASAAEAAEDAAAAGATVACLCSSDDRYAEEAAEVAAALKAAGVRHVYLAGKPGEHREAFDAAGVDGYVHLGVDVLAVLRSTHELLGVAPATGTES